MSRRRYELTERELSIIAPLCRANLVAFHEAVSEAYDGDIAMIDSTEPQEKGMPTMVAWSKVKPGFGSNQFWQWNRKNTRQNKMTNRVLLQNSVVTETGLSLDAVMLRVRRIAV
ncbi:hypothetical protein HGG76_19350 [Ochrobactrum tritici]|uniref:Uncharacterized protein n=1 Tax=Brucella tritici TaxID=94626 RepID=A0A7X6FU01_9HYPH|nr:hypothetical protein [Brucella tritici]